MLTIIVGNTKCKIIGLRDPQVIKALDNELSYIVQGHQFAKNNHSWDGRQRLFTKNHYFPVGLLSRTEKILKQFKISYEIKDNRDKLEYGTPIHIDPNSNFRPRKYQLDAVNAAKENGGGIIRLPTGAGKTAVISMILANFNIKTIIYVIGIELLYQMKDTLQKLYPNLKIGMVGDGICDIQQITIATIWSAANAFGQKAVLLDNDLTPYSKKKDVITADKKEKIREMVRTAELFLLDECQYASSETVKLLHQESIAARHRFLLSGTPWRDTGDDILIEAVGGPIFFNLNASSLIEQGWLIAPQIHYINIPNQKNIGSTYQEVYRNYITDNKDRNEIIVKAAKKLVEKNRKVLILISQVSHGKKLLALLDDKIRVASLDGQDKSEDRLAIIKKMKNGELDCLIASKIFDQGVDIPELDALVLAGGGKSSGRALQRIGRVIRIAPNKTNAIVVDFIDNCRYLKEHTKARQKIFSTEPKFKIILPKG